MSIYIVVIVWIIIIFSIIGSVAKSKKSPGQGSAGTASRGGIQQRANVRTNVQSRVQSNGNVNGGGVNRNAGQGQNVPMGGIGQNGGFRQAGQSSQADRSGYAAQIADHDYGSAADHKLEEENQAKDRVKKREEMAEVHKGSETTMEEWAHVQKKKKIGFEGRPESRPSLLGGDVERADRIPDGTKVIHCSYCGAGNIVPIGKAANYHCYFCWERLEK